MLDQLLDAVLERQAAPGVSQEQLLQRLREADSRFGSLYNARDVAAADAYADPIVRAAYQLRYQPHYVLQLGDLLRQLEGVPEVAGIFSQPHLRHIALCGGPAPEPIALAVLHQQGGGRHLHSTVLDRGANHWRDCWASSARVAMDFSLHPKVDIDGFPTDLAYLPSSHEKALLANARVFSLMNALNELLHLGAATLESTLATRISALPPGALVLVTDQALYQRTRQGIALVQSLLASRGARFLVVRTSPDDPYIVSNRFEMVPRLQNIYGQPAGPNSPETKHYRIHNKQLQLAAILA